MMCDIQSAAVPAFPVNVQHLIPSDQKALLAVSLDGDERMTFDGVWFNIERKSPVGPIGAWQVKYQFGTRPEAEEEMMADGGPNPRIGARSATTSFRVTGLSGDSREAIREAVATAMEYWPNAHLGDVSPREDMRSAFKLIRGYIANGLHPSSAAAALEQDAMRYRDM